ncbi:MAG TPA: type II secretion system protein [Acidimicrobiales bacterium]|jgi:prepilin-type N-terminal cleavage/methylation domain-containing protein|nr:type II secretion system protein [Acidimicrobiales bacterium]
MSDLTGPRARRHAAADEQGFTLIEVSVVLLIMAVVLPMIMGFVFMVQSYTGKVAGRTVAAGQAQVIDENLSRQIHAITYPAGGALGSDIVTASATEFKFYTALGNSVGPTLIDIKATAACGTCSYYQMNETTYLPVLSGSAVTYPTGTTKPIGTGVVVPSSPAVNCPGVGTTSPVFEYYATAAATQTATCLQTTTNTLTTFKTIDQVRVNLVMVDYLHTKLSQQIDFSYTYVLPNVDYQES